MSIKAPTEIAIGHYASGRLTTAPWTMLARLDSSLFLVGFLRDALLAAGGNLRCGGEVQVVGGWSHDI